MERCFAHEAQSSNFFQLGQMTLGDRLFVTRWRPLMDPILKQSHRGGLVISEPLAVRPSFERGISVPSLCNSEQVNWWREVACASHQQGRLLCAQLTQSAMPVALGQSGPSDGDLQRCFEAFRDSAENAIDAGFDGIELAAGPGTVGAQLLGVQSALAWELLQVLLDVWDSRCCVGLQLAPESVPSSFIELDQQIQGELSWLHIGPCTPSMSHQKAPAWRQDWKGALLISGGFNPGAAQTILETGWVTMVGIDADTAQD